MKLGERFRYPRPAVRPLKIYASDPMVGRDVRTRISIDARNEPLRPGPFGARIAVVDYDASHGAYYVPVDLDDPAILMQGGLEHSEGDPRFHQQMVYAVASRILESFDKALGRPVNLSSPAENGAQRPLRLFPHAFVSANAFYSSATGSILFGYFRATERDFVGNIPGQIVFSCLSHDVIAHEMAHALIHRLSPSLMDGMHPDSFGLHEGIADLVAILDRFSLESVVADEIQRTRGVLSPSSPLCQVAPQFGAALGKEHGLRSADLPADPAQYRTTEQSHDRGSILMSATIEAMCAAYNSQTHDLFEIARVSRPSADSLHPDLVARLSKEASRVAAALLTMYIRAFDYLPPGTVSFGDFLRAVVTADWELAPDDRSGLRAALIEAYRRRGIYATGARSLAEQSLIWERPTRAPAPLPPKIVAALTTTAQSFRRIRPGEGEGSAAVDLRGGLAALHAWARSNARALHLRSRRPLQVQTPRYSFRVGQDGQLAVDIIVRFTEKDDAPATYGVRPGVTVVASADGNIRYVVPNQPLPALKFTPAPSRNNQPTALKAIGGARPRVRSPFGAVYRLTPTSFRRRFPHLALTRAELAKMKDRTFW